MPSRPRRTKKQSSRSEKPARDGVKKPRRRAPRRKTSSSKQRATGPWNDQPQRLQKVLASAGIGSRRECEELIRAGRVEIDHLVVTELGTRVDPVVQEIRLDGVPLPRPKLVYYAVNKPDGVLCTNSDPSGRPRVIDLVPTDSRLFTVGRLDLHSEGLILLTNDGELANRLTHPRYGVEKVYRVQVAGQPNREVLAMLRRGIRLAEGVVRVKQVHVQRRQKQSSYLEMVLDEGRNREIRRVLAKIGHKVLSLERIAVGPIRLGKLGSGEYRLLSRDEIQSMRQITRGKASKKSTPKDEETEEKPRKKRGQVARPRK